MAKKATPKKSAPKKEPVKKQAPVPQPVEVEKNSELSPVDGKPMVQKTKRHVLSYKGKSIEIDYAYLECQTSGEHFTNDAIDEQNLKAVHRKYQTRYSRELR